MKGLEEQRYADVMETTRKVVAERRASHNEDIKAAVQYWKTALIDAVSERMIDPETMSLQQMAAIVRRIEEALDGMRLEVEFIIHVDNVCYEFCAGTVTL